MSLYRILSRTNKTPPPLQLLSKSATKEDEYPVLSRGPNAPPSPNPAVPLDDTHPPAAHRRPKLDATLEIELRRACAVILRDLKPSGHDLEDTRMKQDILVEGNSDEDLSTSIPKDVPKLPVTRSGQRAQQKAIEARDTAESPAWPLSPTLTNVSGKEKRKSRPTSDSLEVPPLRTKLRVDAMMLGTSGPTSPLREELNGGLAPVQTAVMSPQSAGTRPVSGYLVQDFYQQQPPPNAGLNDSISSTGSSVGRHTDSTNRALSESTNLSSPAFTTPAFTSKRASQIGTASSNMPGSWPTSADKKTFDAVEEGEQDRDEPARPNKRSSVIHSIAPLALNRIGSGQQSSNQSRPATAVSKVDSTQQSSNVSRPATGTDASYLKAQAVPIIHSRSTSSVHASDGLNEKIIDRRPSTVQAATAQNEAEQLLQPPAEVSQQQESTATQAAEQRGTSMIKDSQAASTMLQQEPPQTEPIFSQDTAVPPASDAPTEEQLRIKASKLANIKDKSDEPLANSRAKMTTAGPTVPDRRSSRLPGQTFTTYGAASGITASLDAMNDQSYMDSAVQRQPTNDSAYAGAASAPRSPATAQKTHQWPITAPVDQLTPPASDAAPTPLVMTPHISSQLTHKQDSTVFVKDFWKPAPARAQSAGRVAQYSNTPSLRTKRSDADVHYRSQESAPLPSFVGPDTTMFQPRSVTPDSPVSSMVRAYAASPVPRVTSPLAPQSQSMTSLPLGPPSDNANKTLPLLPGNAMQGYFPPQVPAVPSKPGETPRTMSLATSAPAASNMARARSFSSAKAGPSSSTTSFAIPTIPNHQAHPAASSTSLAQSVNQQNYTAGSTNTHTRSQSMHSQKPTPSMTRRNIPPYVPGYGHIGLVSNNASTATSAKHTRNVSAASAATTNSTTAAADRAAVLTQQQQKAQTAAQAKGIKGLLFKLGGGDMPPPRQARQTPQQQAAAAKKSQKGKKSKNATWVAPPLAYGYGQEEDMWYDEDYDEMACAAPIVPFGRGW